MGRDDDDNDDVGMDGGWVDLARVHPVRDYDPNAGGPQHGRRQCPPGRGTHAIGLAVVALSVASSAVRICEARCDREHRWSGGDECEYDRY